MLARIDLSCYLFCVLLILSFSPPFLFLPFIHKDVFSGMLKFTPHCPARPQGLPPPPATAPPPPPPILYQHPSQSCFLSLNTFSFLKSNKSLISTFFCSSSEKPFLLSLLFSCTLSHSPSHPLVCGVNFRYTAFRYNDFKWALITDICRCCFASLICILLAFDTEASGLFNNCLALDVDVCFASFSSFFFLYIYIYIHPFYGLLLIRILL